MTRTSHYHPTPIMNWISRAIFFAAAVLALAPNIALAETLSGTLNSDNPLDEYDITLPTYGTLVMEVTTGPDLNLYGGVYLYDADSETSFYGTIQAPDTTITHKV